MNWPQLCPVCRYPLSQPARMTAMGWVHEACAAGPRPGPADYASAPVKIVGFGCLGLLMAGMLTAALVGSSRDSATKTAPKRPAPVTYTVAAEYMKDKQFWEAVVVPRGTSDAKLCELAKWLHGEKWNTRFHLFDDGARVGEFAAWTQAYPAYQRPKPLVSWMSTHHRGLVGPERVDTWALHTVTGDSPASRREYPCEFPR